MTHWERDIDFGGRGSPEDAALRSRNSDPRSDPRSSQFDRDFATETDRLYQQRYGTGPGPSSEQQPPRPAPASADQLNDAALKARLADPRNDPRHLKFDRDFAAETDRLYQQRYSDGGETPANPQRPAPEAADQVPAKFSDYRLGNSEALAPFVAQLESDDLYNYARETALKNKITAAQFDGFMRPVLEWISKNGDGPLDTNAELRKLTPADALQLDEKQQRAAAGRRVEAALSFVERDAVAQGLDPKAAAFVVEQLGDHALGVQALEFFRSRGQRGA